MALLLSGANRSATATMVSAFPHPPQVKTEYGLKLRRGNVTERERRLLT